MLPCGFPAQYQQQQQQQQQQHLGVARACSSQQESSPAQLAARGAPDNCSMLYGQMQQSQQRLPHESAGCMHGHSEASAATAAMQPAGSSSMRAFAASSGGFAGAAAADVRAATAVEAVAPGSTAWAAATELIKLQGQEPTIPLVTLVAARLLAQQRQQQDGTLDLLGGSSSGPAGVFGGGGRLLLGGAAAAAGGGRTAGGTITRFCKRGSVFNAKPAAQRGVLGSAGRPWDAAAAAGEEARAAQQQQQGRMKGRTTCQVAGCLMDLPSGKDTYNGRYRVCAQHMMDPAVMLYADAPQQLFRFCNQCFKFEPLQAFDGLK
eukprot:jgi/Sobl393_1/18430/SZX65526.1